MKSLFLDCDGVLADFDEGATTVLGMTPDQYRDQFGEPAMWQALREAEYFYATLPIMPDARALYTAVERWQPTILTGCPQGDWARPQKLHWRDTYFPGVPMITTLSREKCKYGVPGDVLVDDRAATDNGPKQWIAMGGVLVHYDRTSPLRDAVKAVQEAMKR